jgi:hypothetical protein
MPQISRRKIALVTTTINIPTALEAYMAQFDSRGYDEVEVIIIGDKKTPPAIREWVRGTGHDDTLLYFGVEEQEKWLDRFHALAKLLRWNSIQRRNLGYLIAAERGAEVIISIDDDNHVTQDDFLSGHSLVGTVQTVTSVSSSTGWFNVCDLLLTEPPTRVVHRGFLQTERNRIPEISTGQRTGRVMVNAGLWLGEPDVDAVTRIVTPVEVVGLREHLPVPLTLAEDTHCPFNSQNTAFETSLLPCSYLIVMGDEYRGVRVSRYDDIWMSYFCRLVVERLGGLITYGRPLVRQLRNEHDLLEDLWGELPAMMLTRRLTDALSEVQLKGSNALDCYGELIEQLRSIYSRPEFASAEEREFWGVILNGMSIWSDACEKVQGT